MAMHGFKPGGSDKHFFLPFKVKQKQISAERAGVLKSEGKLEWTFSPKNACNLLIKHNKRVLYHLPNGLYAVMR